MRVFISGPCAARNLDLFQLDLAIGHELFNDAKKLPQVLWSSQSLIFKKNRSGDESQSTRTF